MDARYHGDQAAAAGMLDFAVDVRADGPPSWLVETLATRLSDLGRYPAEIDHRRALVAPSFTEPEAVLSAAGVPIAHVVLEAPFTLTGARVPDEADLVVVGNPTNPTGVLHSLAEILDLRRPGRIVVVDEAFGDAVPGEPESLARDDFADVVVLRSLTKKWSLAGLRVGYALGAAEVLARPFRVPDAELMRKHLDAKNIAVRRGDTFVGLDGHYLRAAVRPEWPTLVEALVDGATEAWQ